MRKGSGGYCSVSGCGNSHLAKGLCRMHYYRKKRHGTVESQDAPEVRFWRDVNFHGPIHPIHGQCWQWTGCKVKSGYGRLGIMGKTIRAHRFSWELFFEPITENQRVLHKCDNPACVNPEHLFLGTDTDNMRDRDEKQRQCKGERCHTAVLTEEAVKEIRKIYSDNYREFNPHSLAFKYKVTAGTIRSALSGKTWKHID